MDLKMQQIALLGKVPKVQPRKVVVDLSDQRVTLYENGVATYSTPCSTGRSGYRTPAGEYVISDQNRHHSSSIYQSSMPFSNASVSVLSVCTREHCPGIPPRTVVSGCPTKGLAISSASFRLETTQLSNLDFPR